MIAETSWKKMMPTRQEVSTSTITKNDFPLLARKDADNNTKNGEKPKKEENKKYSIEEITFGIGTSGLLIIGMGDYPLGGLLLLFAGGLYAIDKLTDKLKEKFSEEKEKKQKERGWSFQQIAFALTTVGVVDIAMGILANITLITENGVLITLVPYFMYLADKIADKLIKNSNKEDKK
jgi:translation elongation factor EF-1beta